jgi:hypothetical protein
MKRHPSLRLIYIQRVNRLPDFYEMWYKSSFKKKRKDHASRNEARRLTCICLTAAHIHYTILHHLCAPKLRVLEASTHQQLTF